MSSAIVKRVCAGLLMILLIAWMPWWVIVIAALAFLFVYNPYYEIVLWGLCLDELYGGSLTFPYSLSATIIACILLAVTYVLKKRLSFYN